MIHLLYRVARRRAGGSRTVLTVQELIWAGVYCEPDTHDVLEHAGIVTRLGDEYELAAPVRELIRRFILAKGPDVDMDVRVDYPEVFVVMPFGEAWSEPVYRDM